MLFYGTEAIADAFDGRQDFGDHLRKRLVVLVGFCGMCVLVVTLEILFLAGCTRAILIAFGLTLTASIAGLYTEIKKASTKSRRARLPDWHACSSCASLDCSYAWLACTVDSTPVVVVDRKDPAWGRLYS